VQYLSIPQAVLNFQHVERVGINDAEVQENITTLEHVKIICGFVEDL
jgi:hypothetical protein